MLHHLQIVVLPLSHFLFHSIIWLLDLIVFTDFRSLFNSCLLPFYHSFLEIFFAIDLNPYNSYLFKSNS
jgi:hypothetical protein